MKFREIEIKNLIPLLTLFILIILLNIINPDFLALYNIKSIFIQASVLMILATGVTFIILTGGIDLSIGALISLSSVLIAVLLPSLGYLAFLAVIIVGALAGLVNGIVITKGKVPSFIVTLGTSGIWMSLAYVLCGGKPIALSTSLQHYTNWMTGEIFGIPKITVISISMVIVFWFVLTRTTFGKYVYSIGNGERASILSGIKVDKIRTMVFMLNSTLVAFGGILLFGRLSSGNPNVGPSYLLPAIASVIVGGTDLTGGFGGIKRSIVGVFIITLIKNGMNVIGVGAFVQQIVFGSIMIIFAAVSMDREKIEILK